MKILLVSAGQPDSNGNLQRKFHLHGIFSFFVLFQIYIDLQ